jgi:hypothetical protein
MELETRQEQIENRKENKTKPLVNADYLCPLQAFLPPSWAFFFSF